MEKIELCSPQRQQRVDDWIFMDVPSDITVYVSKTSFQLHKFPLVSRSGRIRKLISERRDANISRIELHNLPGGIESFELVAKFAYGINFEITTSNVAQLRCVSEYLEMTEEYASENLVSRSEAYLDGVVWQSLEMSIEVLQKCKSLLPLADEVKIVGRCVEAIASKACTEQIASSFSRLEYSNSGRLHMNKHAKDTGDWWIEDLSVLHIDFYRRVIEAMKCRGVHPESIGASLVNYSEKLLKRKPNIWNEYTCSRTEKLSGSTSCEEKTIVETISCLLPVEKLAVPISFLFGLLRSAVMLDCGTTCRQNLERRIGSQLEMASLDDLLIPSLQNPGQTLFDIDTVHKILVVFSQQDDSTEDEGSGYDSDGFNPPTQSALVKVGKLIDSYLAEIAPDANLKLAKFIAVADTLPGYARIVDDGLYRAIDIYLKAHQGLSDLERKRLCKLVDFHKLSEEASAHAAQNERLPLQAMVKVLYIKQLKLRSALSGSPPHNATHQKSGSYRSLHIGSGALSAAMSPRDNYASLRRENRELKLELARMRVRLNDLERGHACMKEEMEKCGSRKLVSSISRKIGRLNFLIRSPFLGSSSPSKTSRNGDGRVSKARTPN